MREVDGGKWVVVGEVGQVVDGEGLSMVMDNLDG